MVSKRMLGVGAIAVAGILAGGLMMGCEEGAAENSVTIDAIDSISGAAGTTFLVSGSYEADDVPAITAAILDTADAPVSGTMMTVTLDSVADDKGDLQDLNMTIRVGTNGACNGTYKLRITVSTTSEVSQSITFKVYGGINCSTPVDTLLAVKATLQKVYNGAGADTGSYDLVLSRLVGFGEPDATKDIRDSSLAGIAFTGTWTTRNGAVFAKVPSAQAAAAWAGATAGVLNQYAGMISAGGLPTVTLAVGDVVMALLGSSRGIAIIRITAIDPADGSGNNTGSVTFEYKLAPRAL